MKKVKIALSVLLLIATAGVVYQNLAFFSAKTTLSLDLYVKQFTAPEIATGLFFLGCFVIGFFLAYTGGLMAKFKSNKMIKELNAVIDSQQEKISTLRGEMDILKRRPVQFEPDVAHATETPSEPVAEQTEQEA